MRSKIKEGKSLREVLKIGRNSVDPENYYKLEEISINWFHQLEKCSKFYFSLFFIEYIEFQYEKSSNLSFHSKNTKIPN